MSLAEVLDENIPPSPTFESSKLLVFMSSIILLWLSEPVLSLIDSSIVGRSSPLALAAMGPATMILDSAIYLCWFLGISTTNLLASTNPPPSNDNEPTKAHRNIIRNALSTASLLGVVVTLLLRFQATPITAAITGSANAAIVPTAVTYVRLRSLAAPFAIVGQACQATCLTSGDVVTPALAVLAASLTNIVLDFTLCIKPFNYGIAGAAFATGVSNVVSTLVLLRAVHKRFFKPTKSSMISLPTAEELSDLFRFAGTIFFVIVFKLICYSLLTLGATRFGPTSLAAHNVLLRLFFFFATFGDSLSQSVQNFLPPIYAQDKTPLSKTFKQFERFHFLVAGAFSLVFSTAALFFLKGPGARLFSTDAAILASISAAAPYLTAALVIHPPVMYLEGSIIAKRDVLFLLGSYIVTFGGLAGLVHGAGSLGGVWRAFVGYNAVRGAQFVVRYMLKRTSCGGVGDGKFGDDGCLIDSEIE